MLVTQVFRWLLSIAEIVVAFPVVYLCMLCVSALVEGKRRRSAQGRNAASGASGNVQFALLVPAHNEEEVLEVLLESLVALDYPKERFTISVIADNCTDKTAELARAMAGVQVLERTDPQKRGKGYALNWAFEQLEAAHVSYDACVIVDADSVVEPTFLRAMEREVAGGALALQACYGVLNSSDSPSAALRWIALALVNHVRPLGRNGLGCSSTLTGNGICLRREVVQRYPWRSFALAEDYHYYLTLLQQGVLVRYVPDAVVRAQMPTTFAQMKTQDIRWESSAGGQPLWEIVRGLGSAGLKYRDLARLEGIAELLTPPLSLLVGWCLLTLIGSLCLWWLPGALVSLALIAGLLVYIGAPLVLLKPPRAIYRALAFAPVFLVWKLWVYFVLRKRKKYSTEWVRTSRSTS
jgi:hypothetical protein